jgi:uncharacterized protein YceK
MSTVRTHLSQTLLLSARGAAALQDELGQRGIDSDSARIGIQKDGKLVVYTGRSFLLHPQQTRRAAQFLQQLQQQAPSGPGVRVGELTAASRHAAKSQLAALASPLGLRITQPPSPRERTGARQPLPLAPRPEQKNASRAGPPLSATERARLDFLGKLSQNPTLAQSVAEHLQGLGAILQRASADDKNGLFRKPLAADQLEQMYRQLAGEQRSPDQLDLPQSAHLIKTLLLPFKLTDKQVENQSAETVYRRQQTLIGAMRYPAPIAAAVGAFKALAEAHAQAPNDTRVAFNKSSIGAQGILFELSAIPASPAQVQTLTDKAAEVLALWQRHPF